MAVVEKVAPSVVNVAAESIVREADPFFGPIFSRRRRAQSLGSGLIVEARAARGIAVTIAHVIEGASKIVVTTLDGRELDAEPPGSDRDVDLAVLKVDGRGLPAVALGGSSDLMIGETVVAIGNPFGFPHGHPGVLSAPAARCCRKAGNAVHRLPADRRLDQPRQLRRPAGQPRRRRHRHQHRHHLGGQRIGFAIPVDRARRVVGDLLRFGELQPRWTGLQLTTVDPKLARRYDLAVDRGVLVRKVFPDSPASAAWLAEDDIIVAVGGQPVTARNDLTTALYSVEAGSPLTLTVRRDQAQRMAQPRPERPPRGLGLRSCNGRSASRCRWRGERWWSAGSRWGAPRPSVGCGRPTSSSALMVRS